MAGVTLNFGFQELRYSQFAVTASVPITHKSHGMRGRGGGQPVLFLDYSLRDAKGVVRIGSTFDTIVQYAKNNAIDLIVIGTHGRTGLPHVLLGSVAKRVVRHAPCSVLTVRPDRQRS